VNSLFRRLAALLFLTFLAISAARTGDTVPFRAGFNVTHLVFPHPTIPDRLEVRVAGPDEASDLGGSTCVTTNPCADLTIGLAVADCTITAANGDQFVVHREAQTVPNPATPSPGEA